MYLLYLLLNCLLLKNVHIKSVAIYTFLAIIINISIIIFYFLNLFIQACNYCFYMLVSWFLFARRVLRMMLCMS